MAMISSCAGPVGARYRSTRSLLGLAPFRLASLARSCSCFRRQSSEQYLAFGACGMKILPQTAQFLSCTSHITVISSTS